jgi:hypothetical protein
MTFVPKFIVHYNSTTEYKITCVSTTLFSLSLSFGEGDYDKNP